MDQNFYDQFKQFGNPYEILKITATVPTKKDIKMGYKEQARINHPDKGGNKEQFMKIQKAYKMLLEENYKQQLDNYLEHKREYDKKYQKMDEARKTIGDKLLEEERMYEEMEAAKKKKKIEEMMKKEEYIKNLKKEHEQFIKDKEKQKQKQENLKESQQGIWQKLCQIKIKWKGTVKYTKNLLKMIFEEFGSIKEFQVFEDKQCAILEYLSVESAQKAVDNYKNNKNNDDSDDSVMEINNENNQESDSLKVKFLIKKKKRDKILEQLEKEKKDVIKHNKDSDYEINSDNLNKIQQVFNRSSKYTQETLSSREQKRKAFLDDF